MSLRFTTIRSSVTSCSRWRAKAGLLAVARGELRPLNRGRANPAVGRFLDHQEGEDMKKVLLVLAVLVLGACSKTEKTFARSRYRKPGAYLRQNSLAVGLRELSRIEHTLFSLIKNRFSYMKNSALMPAPAIFSGTLQPN